MHSFSMISTLVVAFAFATQSVLARPGVAAVPAVATAYTGAVPYNVPPFAAAINVQTRALAAPLVAHAAYAAPAAPLVAPAAYAAAPVVAPAAYAAAPVVAPAAYAAAPAAYAAPLAPAFAPAPYVAAPAGFAPAYSVHPPSRVALPALG